MRKTIVLFIAVLLCMRSTRAQAPDSVRSRVILIGDAGKIDPWQRAIIENASAQILPGKTTVLYLGDDIYPRGMGLPGSPEEAETKKILQSQYQPMRQKGAPVYFLPGNHDWDKSGVLGLKKIKRLSEYLDGQQDSLLKLVPHGGCPDPYEIDISDSLVVIAFDSEWWLYPFDKDNPDADCDCKTRADVVTSLQDLLYKNRYKVILLAAHHPFRSYGHHGGHYSWKDHIFPLTAVNKDLYIPLPVIGSLYPVLRNIFTNPEDLRHPMYRMMVRSIDGVFTGFPNLVHVAGHEHGLQFIKKGAQVQVVSGAGSKKAFVKKGKYSLFAATVPGYVTADLLTGNALRVTYYEYSDSGFHIAFRYTKPYRSVKRMEEAALSAIRTDSLRVRVHPSYDSVSGVHRWLFGENYRKEWAAPTTLPVLRISEIAGGLTPLKRGGGHQTLSLRLKDSTGRQWVLRSVEKYPAFLLPPAVRETFAKDIVNDAMSAQHPFAALVVPPIARAAGVPHAHPVIGVVAPDKRLGIYSKIFANRVCLLEEREPLGNSDNTAKMLKELREDNDHDLDSTLFLRARLLDLLLGDWDRHADQWRWVDQKKGHGKHYIAVPRDRDQVFYINEGLFPSLASRPWIAPFLQGFSGRIRNAGSFFFSSTDLNERLLNQFSYDQWMQVTRSFVASVTDSVLRTAVRQLPASSYALRGEQLFALLKARRDDLPRAMARYYRFLNRVVDIETTDKNELVEIKDAAKGGLEVTIHKLSKKGKVEQCLFSKTFDPSVTREIRLFVANGDDSVVLDDPHASIKLRIVGGRGQKDYNVIASGKKADVYDRKKHLNFHGDTGRLRMHLSGDSANTAIVPSNPFNMAAPLITGGFNIDDGLLLGAGLKYTRRGFRKKPYASIQQLTVAHAFSTNAFRIRYSGEWRQVLGPADLVISGAANAPNNTQNFFGSGNETPFVKMDGYKKFYRSRFDLYRLDPAIQWKKPSGTRLRIGPSFQYYRYDSSDNKSRFIQNGAFIGTYDSSMIGKDKMHLGMVLEFTSDKRNNGILPAWGSYIDLQLQGYTGLNHYSRSYGRLLAEAALYKPLNARASIILADRAGGGLTVGKPAFYQSLFLGGQGNLFGYRQYRFAGEQFLYNNFELRVKLADFASYILPGQFGMVGLYDIGRVWQKGETSRRWHNGAGGGFYFAPAQMLVVQLIAGYSGEGWYPYLTLGFRF